MAVSNGDLALSCVKQELVPETTPIYLQTCDSAAFAATREVVHYSPFIAKETVALGKGSSIATPLQLPKQVTAEILKLIIDYIDYHSAPGRSDKERKLYDERFVRTLETKKLCEVTVAADALEMRQLVDMTSRALARLIEGRSPNEIREAFNLPDDLSEEEKLQPVKNLVDDPRIRLLNRLYAKKRQELQTKKQQDQSSAKQRSQAEDTRSLEDLVSFIEAGPGASKSRKSTGQQAAAGKERSKSRKSKQSKTKTASKVSEDVHKPSSRSPVEEHPASSGSSSADELQGPGNQADAAQEPEIVLAPEFRHIMAEMGDDDDSSSPQAPLCLQAQEQHRQQAYGHDDGRGPSGQQRPQQHKLQGLQQQQQPGQGQSLQANLQGSAQHLLVAPSVGSSQGYQRDAPASPGTSYCSSPHSCEAYEGGSGLGAGSSGSSGGLHPARHCSHAQLLGPRPYRGSRLPALPALEPGDDTDGEPTGGMQHSPARLQQ